MTRIIIPIVATTAAEALEIQSALQQVMSDRAAARQQAPSLSQEAVQRRAELHAAQASSAKLAERAWAEQQRMRSAMEDLLFNQVNHPRLRPAPAPFKPLTRRRPPVITFERLTPKNWPASACR